MYCFHKLGLSTNCTYEVKNWCLLAYNVDWAPLLLYLFNELILPLCRQGKVVLLCYQVTLRALGRGKSECHPTLCIA